MDGQPTGVDQNLTIALKRIQQHYHGWIERDQADYDENCVTPSQEKRVHSPPVLWLFLCGGGDHHSTSPVTRKRPKITPATPIVTSRFRTGAALGCARLPPAVKTFGSVYRRIE